MPFLNFENFLKNPLPKCVPGTLDFSALLVGFCENISLLAFTNVFSIYSAAARSVCCIGQSEAFMMLGGNIEVGKFLTSQLGSAQTGR